MLLGNGGEELSGVCLRPCDDPGLFTTYTGRAATGSTVGLSNALRLVDSALLGTWTLLSELEILPRERVEKVRPSCWSLSPHISSDIKYSSEGKLICMPCSAITFIRYSISILFTLISS